jgi:hypothetical protein
MFLMNKPSFAARTAVIYVTLGSLIAVWSGIWYWYLSNNPPENVVMWYWCYGFLLTGLTLIVIGLTIGQIGRSARHAELPLQEATPTAAKGERDMAARAPVAVPLNPVAPSVASPKAAGQPVLASTNRTDNPRPPST